MPHTKCLFMVSALLCLVAFTGCMQNRVPAGVNGAIRIMTPFTLLREPSVPNTELIWEISEPRSNVDELLAKSELVSSEQGTFHVYGSGGAVLVSPRCLLLSDHQLPLWDKEGSVYLPKSATPLHRAKIIEHEEIVDRFSGYNNDEKDGWVAIRLTEAVEDLTPLPLVAHPDIYNKKFCYVPIHKEFFLLHNKSIPRQIVYQDGDTLYFRGILYTSLPRRGRFPMESTFHERNVVVCFNAAIDLRGMSGYPILVYNEDDSQWESLAVIILGNLDKQHDQAWLFATYPSREQRERFISIK